ncbi:MAG: hypothetical protein WBQ18_03500 [Solirubrobacteraceae bacterium]
MPIWLFPLGLLGGIVLVSIGTPLGILFAMVWGFVVFPHCAAHLLRRWRSAVGGDEQRHLDDIQTHYWRTTLR